MSDGRVELVVEGGKLTVDSFLKEIKDAMNRYIHDVEEHAESVTDAFSDFTIRY